MCDILGGLFGGGKSSSSDAIEAQRAEEERRAQRVREGTTSINQQFARFDPAFFGQVEQAALDFFNPQLNEQFSDTREGLIKNLARSGNLDGSVGVRRLGRLEKAKGEAQAQIGDRARSIAQGVRADVENNRAALIQNLAATADPFAAANAAAANAQALTRPPEFSPIGDLFTKFANVATPQIIAARSGFNNAASTLFPSLGGSATVVNA